MRIHPFQIKISLESNPLKSTMLVGRLGVAVQCPEAWILFFPDYSFRTLAAFVPKVVEGGCVDPFSFSSRLLLLVTGCTCWKTCPTHLKTGSHLLKRGVPGRGTIRDFKD